MIVVKRVSWSFGLTRTRFYLEDFGAVLEGVRVADIVDQADNVTGQVSIRQVVEVREHFMKLRKLEELCLVQGKNTFLISCFTMKHPDQTGLLAVS